MERNTKTQAYGGGGDHVSLLLLLRFTFLLTIPHVKGNHLLLPRMGSSNQIVIRIKCPFAFRVWCEFKKKPDQKSTFPWTLNDLEMRLRRNWVENGEIPMLIKWEKRPDNRLKPTFFKKTKNKKGL